MKLTGNAKPDSKKHALVPMKSHITVRSNLASRTAVITLATLMCAAACSNTEPEGTSTTSARQEVPASDRRVTPQELALFLDWHAEVNDLLRRAYSEATANQNEPMEDKIIRAKRNAELGAPLRVREPFKRGIKGDAMRAVLSAFYISGSFHRDEKELAVLRGRYGAELIDSIASQETLFRQKLDHP
jgi:hypothetical protein